MKFSKLCEFYRSFSAAMKRVQTELFIYISTKKAPLRMFASLLLPTVILCEHDRVVTMKNMKPHKIWLNVTASTFISETFAGELNIM